MSYTSFMSKYTGRTAQEDTDIARIQKILESACDDKGPSADDLIFIRAARERIPFGPRRAAAITAVDRILEYYG